MSCAVYKNSHLYIENVNLQDIATEYGTPCYVYSRSAIEKNWYAFNNAFKKFSHLICYSVKANSNIAILNLLAKLNSGFDIVSQGELERVIAAKGDMQKVIFSGVGKTSTEITRAIAVGIYCFDVESLAELERLQFLASKLKKQINIALRVNPDIDARTHTYISTGLKHNKFGIPSKEALAFCAELKQMSALRLIGLACHIGSQLVELTPFLQAVDHMLELYSKLKRKGFTLKHLNIGGGLGIKYRNEKPPDVYEYAKNLENKLAGLELKLIIEPGRAIVGNAGILLTKIEYLKHSRHSNFAIVDAGMNDFLRPALYDAWQHILPVHKRATDKKNYDVVGPVCESADFLGKNRKLNVKTGDLLAVDSAGAYGFSMSSNYNSRCRPAEILVDGNKTHLIRKRETFKELIASECIV